MQVRALISRPPFTIAQHDTVERAAELMARHAIHSLPVVDPARATSLGFSRPPTSSAQCLTRRLGARTWCSMRTRAVRG
jgi:CBS-domain-containing membrane protein